MALTITTLNVRSIKSSFRVQSSLTFLSTVQTDIVLIQECGLPFKTFYQEWESKWSHGPSVWSGSNNNKSDGVAVLMKNAHILVKGSTVLLNGRMLLLNLNFLGKDFKLINVYGFSSKNE